MVEFCSSFKGELVLLGHAAYFTMEQIAEEKRKPLKWRNTSQ